MDNDTKNLAVLFGAIIAVTIAAGFVYWMANRTVATVETAIVRYEEFQEINNTVEKINGDLCAMRDLDEKDRMFEQFSKQQRIAALKANLNRWIEEYNAKSKMITRSLWKSSDLPYQLSAKNFDCYEEKN